MTEFEIQNEARQLEIVISDLLNRSASMYSAGEMCELAELYQEWQKLKRFGDLADWFVLLQRCKSFRDRIYVAHHLLPERGEIMGKTSDATFSVICSVHGAQAAVGVQGWPPVDDPLIALECGCSWCKPDDTWIKKR